jgi:hypothetical protein
MRCLSAIGFCGRVAPGRRATVAAVAFALALVGVAAGVARAQDAVAESGSSVSGSSWERTESVLEVPPVYHPDSSAPADGCAEDCADSIAPGAGEAPIAVAGSADDASNAAAGTADTLTDESASADDSTLGDSAPDGAGSRQQAAAGIAPYGADSSGNSSASAAENSQNDDRQQAEADRGNYVIPEAPVIIAAPIGAPIGSYAATTRIPAPIYSGARAPSPAFPSASWMPRPVPGIAPLPPMVAPVGGRFGGGFPQMPGFAIGLGHR